MTDDTGGSSGAEEIDLSPEEEEALDRAWQRIEAEDENTHGHPNDENKGYNGDRGRGVKTGGPRNSLPRKTDEYRENE